MAGFEWFALGVFISYLVTTAWFEIVAIPKRLDDLAGGSIESIHRGDLEKAGIFYYREKDMFFKEAMRKQKEEQDGEHQTD